MAQRTRKKANPVSRLVIWFVVMIPGSLWVIHLTQLAWEWNGPETCTNPRLTFSSTLVFGGVFLLAATLGTVWTAGTLDALNKTFTGEPRWGRHNSWWLSFLVWLIAFAAISALSAVVEPEAWWDGGAPGYACSILEQGGFVGDRS